MRHAVQRGRGAGERERDGEGSWRLHRAMRRSSSECGMSKMRKSRWKSKSRFNICPQGDRRNHPPSFPATHLATPGSRDTPFGPFTARPWTGPHGSTCLPHGLGRLGPLDRRASRPGHRPKPVCRLLVPCRQGREGGARPRDSASAREPKPCLNALNAFAGF